MNCSRTSKKNIPIEKSYKGNLNIRLSPDLHKKAAYKEMVEAMDEGVGWIVEKLRELVPQRSSVVRADLQAATAANTAIGIDIGLLQFYHDFDPASRRRRWFKGEFAGDFELCRDVPSRVFVSMGLGLRRRLTAARRAVGAG